MRWVQQAALYPHRCAVLPYVGNTSTRFGFLDTGMDVDLERIYLSGEFFHEVVPKMGFVPEGNLAGLQAKLDQKDAEIADLKAELQDRDEQLAAIDRLQRHKDFYTSAKPGRPRKKVSG